MSMAGEAHFATVFEWDLDPVTLAGIVGLGLTQLIDIDDDLALGALADLITNFEGLAVGPPHRCGVTIGDRGSLEKDDVKAVVGNVVVVQG